MKKVEITWIDSKGATSDWEFTEDIIKPIKPCLVVSVGYLFDENDECKTIVQSDGGKQIVGRMTIPAVCIKKTEELEVGRFE